VRLKDGACVTIECHKFACHNFRLFLCWAEVVRQPLSSKLAWLLTACVLLVVGCYKFGLKYLWNYTLFIGILKTYDIKIINQNPLLKLCGVNYMNIMSLQFTSVYTGRLIIFSMITNIYNKKTKGPTLMELFTVTGKLKKGFFFYNKRCSMCVPRVTRHTSIWYSSSCHTRVNISWRVCGKNLNIVLMCAMSPVVHTSNITSCQKRKKNLFQFSYGCEQFH